MTERDETGLRGFWSRLLSAARKTPAEPSLYEARCEGEGDWTVIRLSTGRAMVVNRTRMTQMRREDAERMVAVLDGVDGADMLAVGP